MSFELGHLFLAMTAYLGLLFLIAYAADRGRLPPRLAAHPLTYTLSLGVYATSWTYYGSVGFARAQGYNFVTIYLGVTLAFLLAPLLLQPILRLARDYQLASLADLFAFRYRSQWAGVLVTLFMLVGVLPYISLQIRAMTESLQVLTGESAPGVPALGFCAMLILFAILFGARHATPREKHEGLVAAIAFESAVKLLALLAVGAVALFGVFGGPAGLDRWLAANPALLDALYRPVHQGGWATLLLLAFAAAFLLPRQFHMLFTENLRPANLAVASWSLPLYLLVLNLPILPVLWAGDVVAPAGNPDYHLLDVALASGSPTLTVVTFIGGVSAASAMVIVATLALAGMCLNHLVLPLRLPLRRVAAPPGDLYRSLLWGRRLLIALIIFAGYGFYRLAERHQGLVQIGLISFVAVAQFLPGVVGLLYWPRATRAGFIAGLVGGATVWGLYLIVPLLDGGSRPPLLPMGDLWQTVTFWSLSLNTLLFVAGSLLTEPAPDEQEAARACCRQTLAPPSGVVAAGSPAQFQERLTPLVGRETARKEVRRALDDLRLQPDEGRPTELRMLRERIERNLSGLVGPLLARMIVDDSLRMDTRARSAVADSVRFMESRLDAWQSRLRGLAAELDALRRYHRRVLQELPLGVCSLGSQGEVVIWNQTMERLAGISAAAAAGSSVSRLAEPWGGLLGRFVASDESHLYKLQVRVAGEARRFNLYKAAIACPEEGCEAGGTVILLEDLTDLYTLEAELAHSERLASIGRLAAGVAHEIGNPLTGIASVAQNLRDEEDPAAIEEDVALILEQTRRIRDIVQSLVSFSHAGLPAERATGPVAVAECVAEAARLVRLSHAAKQVVVRDRCDRSPGALRVTGERQRLVQLFVNLLSNACDASRPGDEVTVSGWEERGFVVLAVEDQGSGIPEGLLDRVFEPFFTTKEPGEGTGLGLPLVYTIVRDHAGTVVLANRPEGGVRVTVRLPPAGEAAGASVHAP